MRHLYCVVTLIFASIFLPMLKCVTNRYGDFSKFDPASAVRNIIFPASLFFEFFLGGCVTVYFNCFFVGCVNLYVHYGKGKKNGKKSQKIKIKKNGTKIGCQLTQIANCCIAVEWENLPNLQYIFIANPLVFFSSFDCSIIIVFLLSGIVCFYSLIYSR